MNDAANYEEFYVSCNPPLLPNGVDFVVGAAKEAHKRGEVVEILYEPEVPWFKVITRRVHRLQVTAFLQRKLREIVEQDTDLLDLEAHRRHVDRGDLAVPVDISVVAAAPRVLPWALFEQEMKTDGSRFYSHRFPDSMAQLPYLALWRGLEETNEWDVFSLFKHLGRFWKGAGAPSSITDLRRLVGCDMSYNMAGKLVYIGADSRPDAVVKGLEALDTLFALATETSHHATHHFILAEGAGPFRFVFKWLSHIGQHLTTHVLAARGKPLELEYSRLQVSVRIMAERLRGQSWVLDRKLLGSLAAQSRDSRTVSAPFAPFEKHVYAKKHPTAVRDLLAKIRQASVSESQPSKGSSQKMHPSHTSQRDGPRAAVETWRNEVHRTVQVYEGQPWQGLRRPQGILITVDGFSANSVSPDSVGEFATQEATQDSKDRTPRRLSHSEDLISFEEHQGAECSDSQGDKPLILIGHARLAKRAGQVGAKRPEVLSEEGPNLMDEEDAQALSLVKPLGSSMMAGRSDDTDSAGECPAQSWDKCHGEGKQAAEGPSHVAPNGKEDEEGATQGHESEAIDTKSETWSRQGSRDMARHAGTSSTSVSASRPITASSSKPESMNSMSEFVGRLEARVRDVTAVLQFVPGHVSIDLRFGRFYLKDLSHSRVDVGSGPSFTAYDLATTLRGIGRQRLGFSTVLSTHGSDMNDLVRIRPGAGQGWTLLDTLVQYEFLCTGQGNERFVVEIDGNSFERRCRGVREELGSVLVHCTQRSWDMKVCATRANCLGDSPRHAAIATALVASMCIKSVRGEVGIEVTADERLEATIDDLRVRHIARYGRGEGSGSALTVTMTKRLSVRQKREKRVTWAIDDKSPKGHPTSVFEASISSLRAEEAMASNQKQTIVERAPWTCESLEAAGAFADICQPALGMIGCMDGIGALNDNGQTLTARESFNDTVAEVRQRREMTTFW